MKKKNRIVTFYTHNMVCDQVEVTVDPDRLRIVSRSPLKPRLLMERLVDRGYADVLDVRGDYTPFEIADFLVAHHPDWVEAVYSGTKPFENTMLPWSQQLVDSLGYTNASMYNAIKYAIENPDTLTFSPTSGFHHATPASGYGFCTFSGQVIASVKLWREKGLRGAYLDLDGHFGNSIEDSREYVQELIEAIPPGMNINPDFQSQEPFREQYNNLLIGLEQAIRAGTISYVVFCHGADSHNQDDGGGWLDTNDWLWCAEEFAGRMYNLQVELGRQIPIVMSLFGGYRNEDYNAVLDLHISSITLLHDVFCS